MAGNKFATMLHKTCHKTIVILIYAVLEWILILLLLLNSLFSYLISKFAKYFGLKPSCTWCTRLDHIFDSNAKQENSYRRHHVCESHGAEISKLAYCTNHRRLAESTNLCRDCSSTNEISSMIAFFTWVREGTPEYGEDQSHSRRCSCCDEILSRDNLYRPSFLFKPTWDVLDYYIQKKGSVAEVVDLETTTVTNKSLSDKVDQTNNEMKMQMQMQSDFTYESIDDPLSSLGCNEDDEDDDESLYITDMLLRNSEYTDSDRFICIELIDTENKESTDEGDEDKQLSSVEVHSEEADLVSSQMDEYKKQEEAEAEAEAETAEVKGLDNFEEKEVEEEEKHTPDVLITKNLHNEMINSEKVEKSFEGSVISEMEVDNESLMTTEHLKTTVEAQQKALNALYTELEEERKAAAEAANETMAMITKLQEEKAAIQTEALQYQRMMEEQAEYDQEALQLLNDLMNKRDKEKQQLEKELEVCRNKLSEYEMEIFRSRKGSGESNYNRSNCGDELYDDVGPDIHQEQNLRNALEFMPDISLAEFDEERLSILEELKSLEAKLFALHDDDGAEMQLSENVVAKELLPLFDATENGEEMEKDRSGGAELQESNKVIMHEELVHVYERLQALEADKEFLKHCIRSMMNGNKGLPLLHEILQHLRDLRSVELLSEEIPSAENIYSSSTCVTEATSAFS